MSFWTKIRDTVVRPVAAQIISSNPIANALGISKLIAPSSSPKPVQPTVTTPGIVEDIIRTTIPSSAQIFDNPVINEAMDTVLKPAADYNYKKQRAKDQEFLRRQKSQRDAKKAEEVINIAQETPQYDIVSKRKRR